MAQNTERRGGSALDGRTTRYAGYAVSLRKRKLIETTFGWAKQYSGLRRMMYRFGLDGMVPDHSSFSDHNHGRFRESDTFRLLLESVLQRLHGRRSDEMRELCL